MLFSFCRIVLVVFLVLACSADVGAQQNGYRDVILNTCPKIVKIFGSGGIRGLESYQSGMLISDDGYVLTVWSYVLDQDNVTVTLDDGYSGVGRLIGYDPKLQIALLKIEASQQVYFDLEKAAISQTGASVLAFSNLYKIATGDEPASVQFGHVSAIAPLSARHGSFEIEFPDPVYIVDAMTNNPGAAGGALTNSQGHLLGMIGKEVRNSRNNAWVNFAIPIKNLADSVKRLRSGKKMIEADDSAAHRPAESLTAKLLGFTLVPDVVSRTPPYIDRIRASSAANLAGMKPDDLIIEVNNRLTPSRRDVETQLKRADRDESIELTIQRGQKFITFKIRANQ